VKASGKFLTAQVLSLQQVIEGLNDSLLRVQHTLQEVKEYSEKERALRLQGSITASNTMWVMVAQLFDSVKNGLVGIREAATPFITPNDNGKDFDVERAVEEARSYRDRVVQQAVVMEAVMEKRIRNAGGTYNGSPAGRLARNRSQRKSVVPGKDPARDATATAASAEAAANAAPGADNAVEAQLESTTGEDGLGSGLDESHVDDSAENSGDAAASAAAAAAGGKSVNIVLPPPTAHLSTSGATPGVSGAATPALSGFLSPQDVAEQMAHFREALEGQWAQKVRDAERKKELQVREGASHLYDLLHFAQEASPIPEDISRPCFRFLEAQGRRLKRTFKFAEGGVPPDNASQGSATPPPEREGDMIRSPHSTDGSKGGFGPTTHHHHGGMPPGESVGVQSDEHEIPSVLDMHSELLARGFNAAGKLSVPAVLLRKALVCTRDSIGKLISNAALFDELSKLIKLEIGNVLHPRSRELITMSRSVEELFTRDSTTNTLLTKDHFNLTDADVQTVLAAARPLSSAQALLAIAMQRTAAQKAAAAAIAAPATAAATKAAEPKASGKGAKGGKGKADKAAAAAAAAAAAEAAALPQPDLQAPDYVSQATVMQGLVLREHMRQYYDERSKDCQTDAALTGLGAVHRQAEDKQAEEQLRGINDVLSQWQRDSEAQAAEEVAARAQEEWYLAHPCKEVQAQPEVKSTTFQTDMTGEVRLVFRDSNGGIVGGVNVPSGGGARVTTTASSSAFHNDSRPNTTTVADDHGGAYAHSTFNGTSWQRPPRHHGPLRRCRHTHRLTRERNWWRTDDGR
jgi:hypothetical protein